MSKHSLESDQTFIHFFHQLWKKDKDLNSVSNVMIPATVVFEHNFPTGYYYYSNGINKKVGKDLESVALYTDFEKFEDKNHGIVAFYLSQFEDCTTGEVMNKVEFLDKESLKEFFFKRKVRDRGILQRFISPKGPNNFMVQAIWSPHITLLERRININRLDSLQSKLSPFERAVTYEGPSHFSNDVFCSPKLKEQVEKACKNIVSHFERTNHKKISRMVLYFKSDRNGDLWLLYCSSVRIANNEQGKASPINLSPRFRSTLQQNDEIFNEFDTLNTMLDRAGGMNTIGMNTGALSGSSDLSSPKNAEQIYESEDGRATMSDEEKWQEHLKMDPIAEGLNDELDDLFYQLFSSLLTESRKSEHRFELPPRTRQTLEKCASAVEHILAKFDIHRVAEQLSNKESNPLAGEYQISKRLAGGIGPMQHRFNLLRKNLVRLYFRIHGYPNENGSTLNDSPGETRVENDDGGDDAESESYGDDELDTVSTGEGKEEDHLGSVAKEYNEENNEEEGV